MKKANKRRTPRSEHRRHYSVEKLPEKLQLEIVEKLKDGERYEAIAEWLLKRGYKVSISSLGRYFHGRVKPEFEELKKKIADRRLLVAELLKIWDSCAPGQDPPEIIKQLLNLGIIANETSITEVSPDRLLREDAKRVQLRLEEERLKLDREKFDLLREKLKEGKIEATGLDIGSVQIYIPANKR
jgi:hypothetical protein